ncbi:MAG TPA: hypothetical protein V6D10_07135 [Trichocoleus sp.]|jgi:hypothetical protein
MSDSPFADFVNATLKFKVAGAGALTPDSRGNLRPTDAIVQVTAMLDKAKPPETTSRPGVDGTAIYLEGFVVDSGQANPLELPSVCTPASECEAIWDGKAGQFLIEPVSRSPWGYEESTGDEIRGWFVVSSFAVNGETWTPAPPTPTPDSGSGTDYQSAETDATVVVGQPLYVKSNGHVDLASASSIATAYVCGLAVSSASASLSVSHSPDSVLELSNWTAVIGSSTLTPGQHYFLSPIPGKLTPIAPTTEGQLVVLVGTALSTTKLSIEIQTPILL